MMPCFMLDKQDNYETLTFLYTKRAAGLYP